MRTRAAAYIAATLVIAVVALSFTQFEIRTVVDINAPPEKVWKAVVDFEHYGDWNTQLKFLGGEAKPGGNLHLLLAAKGADPYEFKPVVSRWVENKEFAWLAITGMPRVFDGEHFFELEDLGNGKTRVVNREEYRGVMSQVMKRLPMMENAPQGFDLMNAELKQYCEKP